jgi:hypothetical protein
MFFSFILASGVHSKALKSEFCMVH